VLSLAVWIPDLQHDIGAVLSFAGTTKDVYTFGNGSPSVSRHLFAHCSTKSGKESSHARPSSEPLIHWRYCMASLKVILYMQIRSCFDRGQRSKCPPVRPGGGRTSRQLLGDAPGRNPPEGAFRLVGRGGLGNEP
jgi:hypothetical protein